ncbi:hypothetical protein E8E12_007101 [Didymella heteroderae]|uniref:Uncharacterized protein n=1 Tax=Didymella heteroderae TaxID=1769908 RepID=A0A9P5C0E9_9PLEO|nr:hypothetical protein E8E12_007101 [Didymella heteroderae]
MASNANVWLFSTVCVAGVAANIDDCGIVTEAERAARALLPTPYAAYDDGASSRLDANSSIETVVPWEEAEVNTTTSDGPDAVPEVVAGNKPAKKAPEAAFPTPRLPPAPGVPARREREEAASPPRPKKKAITAVQAPITKFFHVLNMFPKK